MFELNATMIIFMLSFLVFMRLLDSWFLSPVAEAIESREGKISSDNEIAKDRREEAKGVVDTYEKNLSKIREEAQKIINQSQAEAKKDRDEKLARVDAEGRKTFDGAKKALQADKKSLMNDLVDEETSLVEKIISKLLGGTANVNVSSENVKQALEESR